MPRGRHRHSQPLHRMLPPLTVAGSAVVLAAASLFSADTGTLRVITVATAVAACAGSALARTWDRSAGRTVAELEAARVREEWRTDERAAELETDLEESREIRGRLEKKLRGKRAELARLRTEHADLLRRYATAESERARALESRRQLQLEAAPSQLALTGASPVGPAAFLKADQALRDLGRNAARQQAKRTVEDARRRDAAAPEEPQGRHSADGHTPATSPAGLPVREHRLVPAVAAAVLPYRGAASASAKGGRAIGGFDFFGTQKPAGSEAASDASDGADVADLDDVVGDEALAEQAAAAAEPEVIDLTAHDDTEQLDMSELRAQA
ncbi:hypothetical protein [Actinacidiphila alni]|uniref:hypothetical protein n=1 Tax=Actinacidiphila alni TaxID=380248 RepID=UPI0034532739